MDKYRKAADKLNEFMGMKNAQFKRNLISDMDYYNSVCDYIQALVDNDLIGAGYGEREKDKVSVQLYG